MTVTDEFNTSADDAERFASLVPQLAIELAAEPGNHHVTIEGSMLSADISGFTALSEKLAAKGKAGAEEITELINICFTELIDAAYAYGGEVIKFGGDALLVLFRGDDHLSRVAAAGLDMQHALHSSPAAKKANLTMTVGASEGPFHGFLVGASQRDLIITGANASHVIHLEGEAEKGDTVVSDAIADALPDTLRVAAHAGGWIIAGEIDQARTGPVERTTEGADLSSLVPESVGAHFEGFAGLGGEHRIATVGFLSVSGLDEHLDDHGPADTRDALAELVDAVFESCGEFGVTPLHTDIAPNGLKFILCAGAPYTEGNTSEALLEAALRIVKLSTPFTLKIGVQRGRVFAGFLGSPFRRTYTLMGDSVNTAARMLGKAHNKDIVAVDDVLADTRTIYAAEEIEPFLVKGKTEPMRASYVFGTTDWVQKQAPVASLVGRDDELAQLTAALESDRYAVQLVGPAGSGKTRLLDELRIEVGRRMIEKVEAHCSPYSASTPYALLQIVLRRTAEIEANADPVTAGELLYKSVRHHRPELLPMLPILAIPAGADVDPTPEASAIDAKFLRDRIHEVSARFIRSALPEDVIFILEDMQWVDDASADFLSYTLENQTSNRWTALISARPDGNWSVEDDPATRSTITLEALPDDLIRALVIDASTTDLPDTVLDRIVPQALGNPLYAVELTKAVESSDGDDIPDSVEQLVSARIDSLSAEARRLLRVASVFGNQFRRSDLEAIVDGSLDALTELAEFLGESARDNFEFENALYREVSYEGLPYGQRKRLHGSVGRHLESQSPDPKAMSGLLASHFSIAAEHDRTWSYGVMAGDLAAKQAANTEAAASYRLALKSARWLRSLPQDEIARVSLNLGEVSEIVGDFESAEQAYDRVRRGSVSTASIRATLSIGGIREKQGRLDQANRWYAKAEVLLPEPTNSENLLVRSASHYHRAGLLHRQGQNEACIRSARLALGAAEDANDLRSMALALHRLHLATVYLKRDDRIGYGPRALEFFEELGDFERQASVLNNLGIQAYFANRWTDAADFYSRATETGLRAGSAIDGMLGNLNSGEILSDQGHWADAIDRFERCRRNWEGGRYPLGVAVVKRFMGGAKFRAGDDAEGRTLLLEARDEFDALGADEMARETELQLWELALHQLPIANRPEEIPAVMDADGPFFSRWTYLRCLERWLAGESAAEDVAASLQSLVESQAGYDKALSLRLLSVVTSNTSAAEDAQQIFDSLGVVQLRPLPERD